MGLAIVGVAMIDTDASNSLQVRAMAASASGLGLLSELLFMQVQQWMTNCYAG
jgi:hypothetical protein